MICRLPVSISIIYPTSIMPTFGEPVLQTLLKRFGIWKKKIEVLPMFCLIYMLEVYIICNNDKWAWAKKRISYGFANCDSKGPTQTKGASKEQAPNYFPLIIVQSLFNHF